MDNTNTAQPVNPTPPTAQVPASASQPTATPGPTQTPIPIQSGPTFTYTANNGSSKGKILMMLALLVVICAFVAGGVYFYLKSQGVSKEITTENTGTQKQTSIADVFSQLEQEVKAMEAETLGIDTEFTTVDSDIQGL